MVQKNNIKGFLFAILGSIGWAISGVCSQYLFTEYTVDADWLTAIRMLFSGIILLILAFAKVRTKVFHIWKSRRDVLWLLAFALIGLLMCQYTFLAAIQHSNSATTTVLQSLNVVIMAIIMAVWGKTKMKASQILAVILAVIGTYMVVTKGNPTNMSLSPLGLTFGLISAVGVVTYTLLSRPILTSWGNTTVTGWGMFIGGLVLFLAVKAWIMPANFDFTAWLLVGVIVIIGTAVSFSIFLEGVKYIGPVKATLIGCLEPASATVLSALFLGTRFAGIELLGFGCIIFTVILSALPKE